MSTQRWHESCYHHEPFSQDTNNMDVWLPYSCSRFLSCWVSIPTQQPLHKRPTPIDWEVAVELIPVWLRWTLSWALQSTLSCECSPLTLCSSLRTYTQNRCWVNYATCGQQRHRHYTWSCGTEQQNSHCHHISRRFVMLVLLDRVGIDMAHSPQWSWFPSATCWSPLGAAVCIVSGEDAIQPM